MPKRKIETIERYVRVYNKIQANYSFSDMAQWTFAEFKSKTNMKTESQFRLARAIGRHKDLQKDINAYLGIKKIPKTIIKPITVKQYIPKVMRAPTVPKLFTRFTKKSIKFTTVKGKRFEITTTKTNFKRDSKRMLKDILASAKRETQTYTGKQIKVNITGNIAPDKKQPKEREILTRSFQSKVRVDKNNLDADLSDLMDSIDNFIADYAPKGTITVSISIVNYNI